MGPFKVIHDRDGGEIALRPVTTSAAKAEPSTTVTTLEGTGTGGLVGWVTGRGDEGVTAAEASVFLYNSSERGEVERARRLLDAHIGRGLLSGIKGHAAGMPAAASLLAGLRCGGP